MSLFAHRFPYIDPHRPRQSERGRSPTPKPTSISIAFSGPNVFHLHKPAISPQQPVMNCTPRPLPHPPPKGKSPDRSEPGALEDAIHEAHTRGDLRQCLQWVLELQGVYLDWDDPRLDTATEDDLCFAEATGMGPSATPEERAHADQCWATRQAEDEAARRVWEFTASAEEKAAARQLRVQIVTEQTRRDARSQYFREPRRDKIPAPPQRRLPQDIRPVLCHPLDSLDLPSSSARRPSRPRPEFLFPVDEMELSSVRSMWLDQGRKGLSIVESLVRPPTGTFQTRDGTEIEEDGPCAERSSSPESIATDSTSTSPSSTSSVPSALFSSINTTTSAATSISTITRADLCRPPSKISPPHTTRALTPVPATRNFIAVSSADSPLHAHLASISLRDTVEGHSYPHSRSISWSTKRRIPRSRRTVSQSGWLDKGSGAIEGFIGLMGRLPMAYLPAVEDSRRRTVSCPPRSSLQPSASDMFPEGSIYLLPLRAPLYPRVFAPITPLPRSPYRPLVPPARPTPRMRLVSNPQFLRLNALQNRVRWGLVPVQQPEIDILTDIARRHPDTPPGRPDVDREGLMFTAKESLLRVAVEGLGRSTLRNELSPVDESSTLASLLSWWRVRT